MATDLREHRHVARGAAPAPDRELGRTSMARVIAFRDTRLAFTWLRLGRAP